MRCRRSHQPAKPAGMPGRQPPMGELSDEVCQRAGRSLAAYLRGVSCRRMEAPRRRDEPRGRCRLLAARPERRRRNPESPEPTAGADAPAAPAAPDLQHDRTIRTWTNWSVMGHEPSPGTEYMPEHMPPPAEPAARLMRLPRLSAARPVITSGNCMFRGQGISVCRLFNLC